jgi:TPR repeat protein
MWSWIFIAGTMLVLMNACGSAPPLPTTQDKSTQVAKQAAGPGSSIQRLRMQAERGNVEAQFALAQAYDRGRDVPKDKTEAVRWYRLAATQGDTFAQNALGDNYWEGTAVPKDDKEAARWWRLAAAQGFAPAQHSLGKMLSGGSQGVPTDKTQAYMWLALSAAQGDEEAGQQSILLSQQLKPAEMTAAKKLVKQWKPTRASVTNNKIVQ